MLFFGIDLHKRTIAIQTVDGEGTVVREAHLAAQRPTLTAYFRHASRAASGRRGVHGHVTLGARSPHRNGLSCPLRRHAGSSRGDRTL